MASKNQVRLEAVAEVQKARAEILKLVETVNKLTEALGKTADKKFQITTGESIAKLDALEAGLVALGNASETTSEKVKKSSAKGAESVEQAAIRQTKAIQKAFDAIEKELAATEKAVSAKEKAQARLDRSATQKERNAQRSIDADKKALASVLASVDKELASEDRKVQRLIAAITRKEAARDREKNRQALRIAQKIDDDKKAVASEDAAAARVVAAERRKAEAFLQSQAASSRHMGQLLKSSEAQDKFSISAQSAARSIQAFFASIIIGKLKELLIEITETGAAFEQYSNLLSVATGSNAAAGETFQSLRGFADTFGLSLEQLVERFPRFAIAAKDSGLELEEVRTVFDAFAIANRAVGNSTEQTQRVFVALEQIFNKGVVQAEELKQQLGDSLPAAYNAMAKAIGVTTKELVVLLKENKVLANEALPALAAELLKTLGPGVLKNVTSVRAEIERMKNAIFLAKVEIAEGAKPELLEMLRVIKDIGENGALSFGQIGEAVGSLYTGISRILTLLNNIASFNLEGLGAQIIQLFSLVTQGVGEVILGINILLTKIPGIPESMRKGAEEAMRAWNQAHEDIRAGFDDVANSGVNSAAAIGDAVNIQGRNAIDALRKAQQEALAIAERQKAAAAQKEEAITKKEQEELDKREQAFEAFFAKIGDLALKQPKVNLPDAPGPVNIGSPSGDFVSDDQILKITAADTKLQKLKETLAELIAKKYELENDPYVTGGQIQAVQELEEKILKTEQAIRKTSETAAASLLAEELEKQEKASAKLAAQMDAYSASVKAALVDLVRDNDAFRDSFTRLDEGSQIAVESLIGNLERAAAAGTATEADFQNFLSGIAAIFGQAGVIGQEFAVGLQASFGKGQASVVGLLQSLAAIGPTALAGAEGMSAATATVVANADEQKIAVQSVGTVSAEAFLAASDAAKASSDEITASFEGAADNAAKAQVRMVDAVARGAGDSVAAITNTIDFASGKVDDFGGLVETIGEKGERSFTMVGDAAKAAGDEVANTINVATDATGKLTVSNEKIEQAGDAAVAAFKEATKEVGAAVGEIGKVDTATKGAKTSSEGLAKAAASTKKSAEDTPAAIDKVSASVALLDGKLAGVEAKLQSCLTIALQLEQCMNRIAQ